MAAGTNLPLITDDVKLSRRAGVGVNIFFSTFFLATFVEANILDKNKAIEKLNQLRNIRNWRSNLIYLVTKKELEKL